MKVLITGASGFIGRRLTKAICERGDSAVCAVRQTTDRTALAACGVRETVEIGDDGAMLRALADCDAAIHLAGRLGAYGVSYQEYYETNCALTQRLAELSVKAGTPHFLFCSTPGVYGFGGRLRPEDAPYAPRDDYEKTKVIAEETVIGKCEGTGTAYTILRPDFVYGPGDRRRAKMYRNILHGRFVLTTSGKSYLHPTYVDDVVQGFLLCLNDENARNQIFNLAGNEDVTSEDYLKTIAQWGEKRLIKINIGYPASVFFASVIDKTTRLLFNKEGFVSKSKIDFLSQDHSSSIEKARKLLNYSPQYPLKRGLDETLAWCRAENLL